MSLSGLTGNPRHDRLITLISEHGYMSIEELAQLLDVSSQTIRRDIRKLSEKRLVTRHHGGAGHISSVINTDFSQREISHTQEKQAIAKAIANYIPDGSTLFLTIGTTVEHVARALLVRKNLRVITNSLRVAHILYKQDSFEVMVPGGSLRPHNGGIIGPVTASFINGFRADYLITSVGAIESDGRMLEFDVNESAVVKAMIAHSRHLLLAAEHSKYHASAAVDIGHIGRATALFSDQSPPNTLAQLLTHHQVEFHLVPTSGTNDFSDGP